MKRIKVIAIKSIGHAITSSFAVLFYAYGGRVGYSTWPIFNITGMHLWFNVRMEAYFCPIEPRAKLKTRNERERDVIIRNRERRRVRADVMLNAATDNLNNQNNQNNQNNYVSPASAPAVVTVRSAVRTTQ
jgi:hypothetical protein